MTDPAKIGVEIVSRQEWLTIGLLSVIAAGSVYGALRAAASPGSSPVVAVVAAITCGVVGFIILMAFNRWRAQR